MCTLNRAAAGPSRNSHEAAGGIICLYKQFVHRARLALAAQRMYKGDCAQAWQRGTQVDTENASGRTTSCHSSADLE